MNATALTVGQKLKRPAVWKSLVIGTLPVTALAARLRDKCAVGKAAEKILRRSPSDPHRRAYRVQLAILRIGDIVESQKDSRIVLTDAVLAEWSRANCPGYTIGPCSIVETLQLCLRCGDKISHERIWVFGRNAGPQGDPLSTFFIEQDASGIVCVDCGYASPDYRWARDKKFVFRVIKL